MHLPATIYKAFDHRTLAGLNGFGCPCEIPQPRRQSLGQAQLIGAGTQLATAAVNTWLNQIQLAHDADTATTQIVNGLEPLLRQNAAAYLAGPATCADQAAALSAYLTAVHWLMSAAGCGNGAYGSAGNRCISDRFGPNGATDPNAKFPWAAYYYLPILNDPRAAACAAQQGTEAGEESAIQNIINATSGSNVQTVAGSFTSGTADLSSVATSLTSGSVQIGSVAIPTIALVGAGILLVVFAMAGK